MKEKWTDMEIAQAILVISLWISTIVLFIIKF